MRENGAFIKKKGFTIAGNALVRDVSLSLKAKGLYLLIMSFITLEDFVLTKDFLKKRCTEGTKAFSSAWDELKMAGYLKVHMTPGKLGWQSEYELLDEPRDGAHSFYHSNDGTVTNTNLTLSRSQTKAESNNERTPQNGIYADGSNAKGIYAKGNNANGCNNLNTSFKTINNTVNNTPSINQVTLSQDAQKNESDGLNDADIRKTVEDELSKEKSIPYHYKNDKRKMLSAVCILTDWYDRTPAHYNSAFEKSVFDLFVDCLAEMACADGIQTYKGASVSYAKVIDKINEVVKRDGSLYHFIEETVDDYISAAKEYEIKDKRKYMQSVIWNSFMTYLVKFESYFARTYGR